MGESEASIHLGCSSHYMLRIWTVLLFCFDSAVREQMGCVVLFYCDLESCSLPRRVSCFKFIDNLEASMFSSLGELLCTEHWYTVNFLSSKIRFFEKRDRWSRRNKSSKTQKFLLFFGRFFSFLYPEYCLLRNLFHFIRRKMTKGNYLTFF